MKIGQIKTNDNKKLLIIVSILIVIGIGLSSAYFLNKQGVFGVGSKTEVTTATLGSSTIKIEGTLNFNDLDILPGHKTISGIKLTATGNNEAVTYNLIWKGINTLNTPLMFSVYKTVNSVDTGANCQEETKVENGKQYLSEACTISNEDSLDQVIASGEITKSETEETVKLAPNEMITATTSGQVVYYYVVLEYPNLNKSQNIDLNGNFSGVVTVSDGATAGDVNILAVYVKEPDGTDYERTEDIPHSNLYVFNSEMSNCTNDAMPLWDGDKGGLFISNLNKSGTSCNLYFDKLAGIFAGEIIADGTATDDSMFAGIEGNGVYTWDKGDYSGGSRTIKYYRGNVDNNWVVFGRDGSNYIWWRIIRNNSNGSLRMIYAGTSTSKTSAPATTGTGTQIGTIQYNTSFHDYSHIGFMYTSGNYHGNGTNSTILGETTSTAKTTLYGWYNQTLGKSTDYSSKIDLDAGFCNDRTPGIGNYAAFTRLYSNKAPSLLCTSVDDIFKIPVGLITADEASMGGMVVDDSKVNTSSYLCTNSLYWTISPYNFHNGYGGYIFLVSANGYLDKIPLENSNIGVRPVVNLKADTVFEDDGNGTSTNPYVVIGT